MMLQQLCGSLLLVLTATAVAAAMDGSFPEYEEPSYFQFYKDHLGADYLKRCTNRDRPPRNGASCRRTPKACLWGNQTCPLHGIQPTTRCNCVDGSWMCQPFSCPTMEDTECTAADPSNLNPMPICKTDLSCGYEEQTCCGKTFPKKICFCQTGTTFLCEEMEICSSTVDCASIEGELDTMLNRKAPPRPDKICRLPADTGPCSGSFVRWYFDGSSCQRFSYGGCGGNSNNFASLADCEQRCCKDDTCNICSLPQDGGPCKGAFPRWFYNTHTGQCEEFVYGGCQGNGNRFISFEECEGRCCEGGNCNECLLPSDSGPCDAAIDRWAFNSNTGACELFTYGGCGGNPNNFETLDACAKNCCEGGTCKGNDICSLPPDMGPCEAAIPRFYYDGTTNSCQQFTYGGCDGNDNNFPSYAACESSGCCKSDDDGGGRTMCNVCALPEDAGPCDASIPRWSFNSTSGQCQEFVYGGCGGNLNNFESVAECEQRCYNRF